MEWLPDIIEGVLASHREKIFPLSGKTFLFIFDANRFYVRKENPGNAGLWSGRSH
jgi:hypothetical protein